MTAKEAREISFKFNPINEFTNLELVYNRIETEAKNNNTHSVFFGKIPDDMKTILENDGFEIRVFGINHPQPITEIKW